MGDAVVEQVPSGRIDIERLLRVLTVLWLLVTPVLFWVALWIEMPVPDRSAAEYCTGGNWCDLKGPFYNGDVDRALLWATGLSSLCAVSGPLGLADIAARHGLRGAARSYRVLAAGLGLGVVVPLMAFMIWLTS